MLSPAALSHLLLAAAHHSTGRLLTDPNQHQLVCCEAAVLTKMCQGETPLIKPAAEVLLEAVTTLASRSPPPSLLLPSTQLLKDLAACCASNPDLSTEVSLACLCDTVLLFLLLLLLLLLLLRLLRDLYRFLSPAVGFSVGVLASPLCSRSCVRCCLLMG